MAKEKLSRREAEALDLLAQGLSDKEIAEKQSIAVQTVKNHLVKAYRKLGVRNRSQALLKYRERQEKSQTDGKVLFSCPRCGYNIGVFQKPE